MKFNLPSITFDFRDHANPADELKELWDSWVPYYTTKAAIAAWLQPSKILEIGVRYGYAGKAFLAGSPTAHYTGIDLNVKTNGGAADDFRWARLILPLGTTLIQADTQKMKFLPGGVYDLIHVDGQQTGASTYHDLELASSQGHWILCDGYFWTAENFNAANDFIRNYRDVIESVIVLPGYAGEMLINIKDSYIKLNQEILAGGMSGEELRAFYVKNKLSINWLGYDSYPLNNGLIEGGMRINSIADIAISGAPKRLLDFGCESSEITIQAVLKGAAVTAIGYSADEMILAEKYIGKMSKPVGQVEWINESPATMELLGKFDIAICGNVLERMTPAEVDSMYSKVVKHLADEGKFVVHTFPNRWFYEYDYPKRQRKAAQLGAHLPFQPRSRIERLIHINEQRPQVMRRQLNKYFKHVLFWFASPEQPEGNLIRKMSRHELAAARDLYAVASHYPIDKEDIIKKLAPTPPLNLAQAKSIKLSAENTPIRLNKGESTEVNVGVSNESLIKISERLPNPIRVSYHWQDVLTGAVSVFDGERTIVGTLYAGQNRHISMKVVAPKFAGSYMLQLRLVQEGVRWHEGEEFETDKLNHLIQVV